MALTSKEKPKQLISEKPNVEKILHQADTFLSKINSPRVENSHVISWKKTKQENAIVGGQKIVVSVPKNVDLFLGEKNDLFVKGARGALVHRYEKDIQVQLGLSSLTVVFEKYQTSSFLRTQFGLLYRMFVGVTKGYKEKIKTSGVGYRGHIESTQLLTLSLGYSHKVQRFLHPTVEARFNKKNNRMNFTAPSLPLLTGSVAGLYRLKEPDVYNGKGVRYRGLKLRKKEGKKQGR